MSNTDSIHTFRSNSLRGCHCQIHNHLNNTRMPAHYTFYYEYAPFRRGWDIQRTENGFEHSLCQMQMAAILEELENLQGEIKKSGIYDQFRHDLKDNLAQRLNDNDNISPLIQYLKQELEKVTPYKPEKSTLYVSSSDQFEDAKPTDKIVEHKGRLYHQKEDGSLEEAYIFERIEKKKENGTFVVERMYDKNTGKITKETFYGKDGKVCFVEKFDDKQRISSFEMMSDEYPLKINQNWQDRTFTFETDKFKISGERHKKYPADSIESKCTYTWQPTPGQNFSFTREKDERTYDYVYSYSSNFSERDKEDLGKYLSGLSSCIQQLEVDSEVDFLKTINLLQPLYKLKWVLY